MDGIWQVYQSLIGPQIFHLNYEMSIVDSLNLGTIKIANTLLYTLTPETIRNLFSFKNNDFYINLYIL